MGKPLRIWRERYPGRGNSEHGEAVTETREAYLANNTQVRVDEAQPVE